MARVLVVDDSLFMRSVLRRILSDHGHDVVGEASDGRQAVRQFDALEPDVVTLDLVMPEVDGLAALKDLRGNGRGARVIVVSAVGQDTELRRARELGAEEYLVKPFEDQEVVNAIAAATR